MKKKQHPKKLQKEEESEDISLYNSENEQDEHNEPAFKEEEEDIDEKRLKLAKRLIEDTSKSLNENLKKTKEDDQFFLELPETAQEQTIEKLQNDVLEQKKRVRLNLLDKMQEFTASKGGFPLAILKGHKKPISGACFCPKTGDLFTIGKDGAILRFLNHKAYLRTIFCDNALKDDIGHSDELLCIDISHDGKYMITGGKDRVIKLWDIVENKHLHDFKGHRAAINCLKFMFLSHEFISGSSDRSMKQWDSVQKGLIQNLYGHRADMLDLDILSSTTAISVSIDKTPIVWKIDKETQMVYQEQLFSLDCCAAVNSHNFVTGSQDGTLCMWNLAKKKPKVVVEDSVDSGWLSALASVYNGDVVVSGGRSGRINFYKAEYDVIKDIKLKFAFSLEVEGCVQALKFSSDHKYLAVVTGPESRLGRWFVLPKIKPSVQIYQLFE